jgi:hypothetical protein
MGHLYRVIKQHVIGIKCRNSLPQGRIQDFKLGGAHLKKLRRAEEGANILGVFRAKNHYFTPKNHSFYNYGGRREKCWGLLLKLWNGVVVQHIDNVILLGILCSANILIFHIIK